jgi:hypothetical protein
MFPMKQRDLPRVRKAKVVRDCRIAEANQECNYILTVLRRQREAANKRVLVRIVVADARVGTRGDCSSARSVVLQHTFERRDAAIVYVRSRQADVTKGRRFEFANVTRQLGVLVDPNVRRWVRKLACEVV